MTAPNEVEVEGYSKTTSIGGVYGEEEYGAATNFDAIDAAKTTEVTELSWWDTFMAWLADIFPFLFI